MTIPIPIPIPRDAPSALRDEIARRKAAVLRVERELQRTYLWLDASGDRLFARYSSDPVDVAVLAHEAGTRERIGERGALRVPDVLARGNAWMLEQAIEPLPLSGRGALDIVIEAATTITGLSLPPAPPAPEQSRRAHALGRLRLLRAPRLVPDLRRARHIRRTSALPLATSHGDFHPGNLLLARASVFVVDWELTGLRPMGHDLLQLWSSLADATDREHVFTAVVDVVGADRRQDVAQLRYALVVQTISAKLASPLRASRDLSGARRLIRLLPQMRRAAFGRDA